VTVGVHLVCAGLEDGGQNQEAARHTLEMASSTLAVGLLNFGY
jgi:hypothetical protein